MMQTVSDQVAERLRAQIAGGALAPGETLPAERRLAQQLGVSRGSLRAGIAQLQAEGLLEARHGSGTRVCADLDRAPLDWLSWVLASEDLAPEEAMLVVRQLVGLRRVVVLHILDEALRVMSSDHVARLEALVARQAQCLDQPDEYEAQERGIERLFIEIAANRVVPLLNESVRRCFAARPEVVRAFMGPLEQHHQANQALLEAVRLAIQELASRDEVLSMIAAALTAFERAGLERVRKELLS